MVPILLARLRAGHCPSPPRVWVDVAGTPILKAIGSSGGSPADSVFTNTLGLHRVMFAVDDIDDTIARLRTHGAGLLGEVAQYENIFRLCYLRGPAGIIVALAEQIG